jgi:hypothetical protein
VGEAEGDVGEQGAEVDLEEEQSRVAGGEE